jgi:hypothetical protein
VTKVAYEPRSGYEDLAGTVSLPSTEAFDVGEALKSGGGKIVLDPDQKDGEKGRRDQQLVEALDGFVGLKRTDAKSAQKGGSD